MVYNTDYPDAIWDQEQMKTMSRAFRKDKDALRETLGVTIEPVLGQRNSYSIVQIEERVRELFLPEELLHLIVLAHLPRPYFPPETLNEVTQIARTRSGAEHRLDEAFEASWHIAATRDDDVIHVATRAALFEAKQKHRILEFDYLPARDDDDEPRRHCIEPYDLFFRDGHFYLLGFCLHTTSYLGCFPQNKHREYRVGRVVAGSVQTTPKRFTIRHPEPQYQVHYILSAKLAKYGASVSFNEQERRLLPDGRIEILATTPNHFRAVRHLLGYGPQCEVLGGPEVLAHFCTEVQQMYSLYFVAS